MKKLSRKTFLLTALLGLGLAACKDAPAPAAGAGGSSGAPATVSVAAVAAEAKGFTVGSEMSVRRVFVFFDPQCPHCAALWQAAKPLKPQARFVWVPVGIINATSAAQGAAILGAPDPVAAMDAHEASLTAKQGGISAQGDLEAQRAVVAANTQLFNRFRFSSVPTVVANHAQTGALVVQEGSMPTATLAAVLGLQPPATP
ncbi:thioredoxin fold domain-containing protein [Ramlibacter tataouinensis]|uniref:Candidate Thiol:disulfide interchange protein dsbG n=1 Tax=Ramlibacter tataouinensis (strain ATCC BAA-407 / DSM 14655 / LMG 21543 / TTB310) TaxID=365046 RepID=F5Y4R9_RAMTT|nr:thioredoxin fold domain-containing protein [Ramlibacter tataouinensis]AEG92575.1 Candidate Thiol:disulfide interchange protein dsbG precursor [Ramlibacter tataouinensis TTB310]